MKHIPRKRFGQHFLSDQGIIDGIVQEIAPQPGDPMVEIGPGLAALTQPLVERLGRLTVIELDRDLAARLRSHGQLDVIESDVLKVDFTALAQTFRERLNQPTLRLRVVGNLPYNISTPILFHLLEHVDAIQDQHFMLQKEVIDRMVASPATGDYGRLSVMLQWRYAMENVLFVPPESFDPPPREDNADMRLTEVGRQMGLVDDARWDAFNRKRDAVSRETERLKTTWVNPRNLPAEESARVLGKSIEREYNLGDLLRRPDVSYAGLMGMDGGKYGAGSLVSRETLGDLFDDLHEPVVEQIEIAAKYAGYIDRQRDEVERAAHYENLKLPAELDYLAVPALSIEVRQKLHKHRPVTLGQASRVSGVTPAAMSLLLISGSDQSAFAEKACGGV